MKEKERVGYVSEEKLNDIYYSPGYSESVSFIKISEKLEGGVGRALMFPVLLKRTHLLWLHSIMTPAKFDYCFVGSYS